MTLDPDVDEDEIKNNFDLLNNDNDNNSSYLADEEKVDNIDSFKCKSSPSKNDLKSNQSPSPKKKINADFRKFLKVTFNCQDEYTGTSTEKSVGSPKIIKSSISSKQVLSPSIPMSQKKSGVVSSNTINLINPIRVTSTSTKESPIINFTTMENRCPVTHLESSEEEFGKLEITIPQESFCSGFFISSLPFSDNVIIEDTDGRKSNCGHKECTAMPAYNPKVLFSHSKVDNSKLEISNEVR